MFEKTKKLKETITLVGILKFMGWLLVFGLSVYATVQSNRSIDIAQKSFVSNQRPWISVKPVKFDDGKFIYLKRISGGLEERFRFEISNKGNSTAQNIKLSPINVSSTELLPENPSVMLTNNISCSTGTGSIALAPGDNTILEVGGMIPFLNIQSVSDLIAQFESGNLSIPFNLEVTYDSASPSISGKTGQSLIFFPDRIIYKYSVLE